MQTIAAASLSVGGPAASVLCGPQPRPAPLRSIQTGAWSSAGFCIDGLSGGHKAKRQARVTFVKAEPSTARPDSAYSRSSWRTAILGESDLLVLGNQGSASDVPADSGSAAQGNGPLVGDCEEGADCGALSAAELRVKLALAVGSGRLDLTDCRLQELPYGVLELTELQELQLSGNCLAHLPDGISRLTGLRRLGLAGNSLVQLPPGIGALTELEGLWLHGNLLESVPPQLGRLEALKVLSLAGNCLESIPAGSLSGLSSLTDLTLAGNRLTALPRHELAPLSGLRKLALNGNRLASWSPGDLGLGAHMTALTELMLQGNVLEEVDPAVFECPALYELSLADNRLVGLPPNLAGASSLSRLHLFGNRLTAVPAKQLASLPALASCWLEGNPLSSESVVELVTMVGGGDTRRLKALGLDQSQIAAAAAAGPTAQSLFSSSSFPSNVRVGCVLGSGPGYFKLQYGPQHPVSSGDKDDVRAGQGGCAHFGSGSTGISSRNELLVVAFGSAPGTPNWGALLSKVYQAAVADGESCFDVLYVADPARDWYGGGDEATYSYYRSRLSLYTSQYRSVLLLGDSMGATAALLFADLGTAALAFCPQVDLTTASIRPGRPTAWLNDLQSRLMTSVRASNGQLEVLVGTWQHDLAQANMLPRQSPIKDGGRRQNKEGMAGSANRGEVQDAASRSWRQVMEVEATASTIPAPRVPAQPSARAWQQGTQTERGLQDDITSRTPTAALQPPVPSIRAAIGAGSEPSVKVQVFSVDSHRLAAALDVRKQLVPLVRDAVLRQLGLRAGNVRMANLL